MHEKMNDLTDKHNKQQNFNNITIEQFNSFTN